MASTQGEKTVSDQLSPESVVSGEHGSDSVATRYPAAAPGIPVRGSDSSLTAAKNNGISRYYAVWMTLWSRIMSGYYPPGSYIGTEAQIADTFGVSRITVRQSLTLLEQDRLVDRRRGKGTFVALDVRPGGAVELTGFLDDIILQVDSATTTFIEQDSLPASKTVALELRVQEGTPVVRVRRLRSNQGLVKLWIINYLPQAVADLLSSVDLTTTSLLRALDTRYETHISYGRQVIEAQIADTEIAERLEVPVGSAVLHVTRTVLNDADYPLEYAVMYYPGSRSSFNVRLGRVTESRGPATALARTVTSLV